MWLERDPRPYTEDEAKASLRKLFPDPSVAVVTIWVMAEDLSDDSVLPQLIMDRFSEAVLSLHADHPDCELVEIVAAAQMLTFLAWQIHVDPELTSDEILAHMSGKEPS